ncbi:OmpA family protein [Granulosicoccus antarcticus]|uniref:Outer membrane porin F n=1 Tax=Granulosicoccus antarcticus IMCC3135 TaxID=1192854 RepID=A0A2Z2P7B6_9GAMM|nr:OmpA family protein [Granulosicoccus antarcticus]ASJ76587.1 Outer membrane porin F [Granulosicoccus antarcticus IMCC3135]
MNRNIGTVSSIAALLLGSSVVFADGVALDRTIEVPAGDDLGYVNGEGNAIKTGLNDCLQTGLHADGTQIDACEGIEDAPEEVAEVPAAPEPAPAPEPVKKEPIVTTATLGGEALFDNNSDQLNSASEQAMADLVNQLEKFQEISAISVIGHTDATGEASYNQGLSERRAASVEAFLKAAYPDADVSSSGMGEDSPVATNSSREGRQLNRRVEVQVTAKSVTE